MNRGLVICRQTKLRGTWDTRVPQKSTYDKYFLLLVWFCMQLSFPNTKTLIRVINSLTNHTHNISGAFLHDSYIHLG